ncbi:MAG: DUF1572 family protein [Planctomycetes bacterium]|nr:DUF1572 family protein [Planctomycetota bacterium]
MTILSAVRTEFTRYRRMVELAVEQIDDASMLATLDSDSNSIAVLLGHLSGNLCSRFTDFLTSDGEKPWRDRDGEFEDRGRDRAALLAEWQAAWSAVDAALADVETAGDGVFERTITIRAQPLTVADALLRSVAHVAGHTGQIVLLARHFAGASWRSLSIPRGGSADYAANPTREKSPDGPTSRS